MLNTYRRLFSLVFIANVAVFVAVAVRGPSPSTLIDAVAANLLASGLARQPLVVNLLFRTLCMIPQSAPLRLRRLACKIFHLGGVHSGCGVAAFVWYIGFVAYYTRDDFVPSSPTSVAVLVIAYAVLVLLACMIAVAYPQFRIVRHDWFELTHRFSSWATMLLVWALVLTMAAADEETQPMGMFLAISPAFWMLLVTTAAIIHPWLLLRRIEVVPEPLSKHAIRLHFTHTSVAFGQGLSVSQHPLRDWHSFAAFPNRHDSPATRFSLLVSRAGDWTAAAIAQPPRRLWTRGVPLHGFGYVLRLFPRVVLVTTGSGIGPCLSFLADEQRRPAMRVLWQTRDPAATYGARVLGLVRRMDPEPVVIDTSDGGGGGTCCPLRCGCIASSRPRRWGLSATGR
ncbi:hypothetical protein PG985_014178 [Apiospora marii]|uniref:uncharacterized protein n=1 Tax=Apiospora marii TaxID=335849 RepID=UPI00312F4C09